MTATRLSIFFACIALITVPALATKPNIVVVLTDDQGWGDLSLHGNKNLSTPNIDRLAKEGAQFDRFYVCPVCSPTRAEFLTGRYHQRGGVYSTSAGGERLDLDEHTIADTFKTAGYATGAFGKWHNGMQYPYHPNGRGFDEFYGFCSGHWAHYFSPMLERNGSIVKGEGFVIDDFTDKAMAFIETNAKAEKPFLAYLPYNTPHSPMQVPDAYWGRHAENELAQRATHPKSESVSHTRAALAMCENIDWNVGRLMKKLDDLGIAENTIVVFFHDNGPNGWRWNGGMRGRKGSTDEGGVRSPLFVRWKDKITPGLMIQPLGAAIDLLPTLADLASVEVKSERKLDGKSLKPLLLEKATDWDERIHISSWRGRASARSQRFRLDYKGRLYDMDKDPGQLADVTNIFPSESARHKAAVAKFRKEVMSELGKDERPFLVGHPDYKFTQIPARDAVAHGGVKRSNKFPNCTHFTNWRKTEDKITWEVEVVEAGDFEVDLYYTCPMADVGSTVELSFNGARLKTKITEAFDPPFIASALDRHKRIEGDDKEWKPMTMGTITLPKGKGSLTLRASEIPGASVMDFRLLMLKRK
jgi:arylsulfatase A-like enzyme